VQPILGPFLELRVLLLEFLHGSRIVKGLNTRDHLAVFPLHLTKHVLLLELFNATHGLFRGHVLKKRTHECSLFWESHQMMLTCTDTPV